MAWCGNGGFTVYCSACAVYLQMKALLQGRVDLGPATFGAGPRHRLGVGEGLTEGEASRWGEG